MPSADLGTPQVREPSIPPSAANVLLICESSPRAQPPGKRRRVEQLEQLVDEMGLAIGRATVGDDLAHHPLPTRFARAIFAMFRLYRDSKNYDLVWISGLGEVHMLIVAIGLAAARRTVIFDACDSWELQTESRVGMSAVRKLIPRIGSIVQRHAPKSLAISYISARDADEDQELNCGRLVRIVTPTAPRNLLAIDPLRRGRIERVVVAADLRSFHNRLGFQELIDAWTRVARRFPSVDLDVYGQGLPRIEQHQVHIFGWADDLRDVYMGQSAVFVTNRSGSGVPNKLIEAIAARRPVVIHSSLAPLLEPGPWVFTYDREPATVLDQLLSMEMQDDDACHPRLR